MTATRAGIRASARAALLAAFSALLTAAGHVGGGGTLPDLAVLAVLLPLLAGLFMTAAERFRGPLGTILVLGAGQLALHGLLELLSPPHVTHPMHPGAVATPVTGMVAVHALATLVTAVALRCADQAMAAIGAALRRVLPRRPPNPSVDLPLTGMVTRGPAVTLRLATALAAAHARRGPPVGC